MELKTAYRVCIIILSLLLMALLLTAFTMLRTEGAQIQQAIEEHKASGVVYECLIPAEVKPEAQAE